MKRLVTLSFVMFFAFCTAVYAQDRTVTGKVLSSEDGTTLPGVSVVVKGTTIGTQTDLDGNYSITIPSGATTIVFTSLGYLSQEVVVGTRTQITVRLSLDVKSLGEVVLVGYGTQLKREITGSQTNVSAKDIENSPILNTAQALRGRATGVQVVQNSGTPGSNMSVRVRGVGSLSAGNQPLYVVDGVPISTGSFSQIGFGGQTTDALSDLNTNDIESIEVLKDAAATAIYGSRASNGVVLITTKRGANQATKISFNTYYGLQNPIKTIPVLTGQQYIELQNEAANNRFGGTANYTTISGLSSNPADYPSTNWQDLIFREAPTQNYDLSFSGGNDRTIFYVSGTYLNQKGIVLGSGFERFSARFNVDNKVSDKFRVGANATASRSKNTRINNDNNIFGVVSTAVLLGSHIPAFNANGTYGRDPLASIENPIAAALEPTNNAFTNRFLSSLYAEYSFNSNLKFRTSVGVDFVAFKENRFSPTTTNAGAGVGGSGIEAFSSDITLINENTLTFAKRFGTKHDFSALGGFSIQETKFESIFASAEGFPGNSIKRLSAGSVKTNATSSGSSNGLIGYLARINYTYNGKYIFQASVRTDASSRFGANNRYATFPAGSIGWRVSEESFLKNSKTISDLKLRASYGLTGNQSFGNFASLSLTGAGANYQGQAGLAPAQLGNPDLTWEKGEQLNIGLDLGLFNNRLTVTVDAYDRLTKDLLFSRPLVGSSGFLSVAQNIGSIQNKGLEFGISSVNFDKSDFKWTTNFNISFVENKIKELSGTPFASGFASWVQEGFTLGSFRGFKTDGIFQDQASINALNATAPGGVYQSSLTRPGDIKFQDLNGDGVITTADQTILGNAQPKFYGGITNNLSFKGLDLSFFFQYSYGNLIYNNTRAFGEGMNSIFGQFATTLNRWTPTNTNTDMPRAVFGDPNNNRRTSDRFLEDGSYIRLKDVTLSYTFESNVIKNLGFKSLRVFVGGNNLWTGTKYQGFDPEVSTFSETNTAPGTDFLTYPQSKTVTFGLNLGL